MNSQRGGMALKLATAPTCEPLTLYEAKVHTRVDFTDDDALIESLITAARQHVEETYSLALVTQTWEMWLDEFPCDDEVEIPRWPLQEPIVMAGAFVTGTTYRILSVGITDFVAIGASANAVGVVFTASGAGTGTGTATASGIIKYYDTSDAAAHMSAADYFVDTQSEPGRISLAYGKAWPSTSLRPANGVCVTFTAGYGAAAAVPKAIKQALLLIIGHLYANREAASERPLTEIPMAVDALLAPYQRVWCV